MGTPSFKINILGNFSISVSIVPCRFNRSDVSPLYWHAWNNSPLVFFVLTLTSRLGLYPSVDGLCHGFYVLRSGCATLPIDDLYSFLYIFVYIDIAY